MRKDFEKVTWEWEKSGRGGSKTRIQGATKVRYDRSSAEKHEVQPKQEKFAKGKTYHYNHAKTGPFLKYLRRQCGRPWDKVYSEISENADTNKEQNLKYWADRYVCRNAYHDEDGNVWTSDNKYVNDPFFVDKHGVLRVTPKKSRRQYGAKKPPPPPPAQGGAINSILELVNKQLGRDSYYGRTRIVRDGRKALKLENFDKDGKLKDREEATESHVSKLNVTPDTWRWKSPLIEAVVKNETAITKFGHPFFLALLAACKKAHPFNSEKIAAIQEEIHRLESRQTQSLQRFPAPSNKP